MRWVSTCAVLLVASGVSLPAAAQDVPAFSEQAVAAAVQATPQQEGSAPPAVAVEYSDAYKTRARIHKIASFATLPLFGAEAVVGQKLYNARINFQDTSTLKSTHLAIVPPDRRGSWG